MKSILKIFLALFLVVNLQAVGQRIDKSKGEPNLDNSIRHGKLKNGVTYFIKNLPKEQSKLDLRLVVKAGKDHQNDDQLNIAHFLEHMAFKTTKNFPKGIYNYIENSTEEGMVKFDIYGSAGASNTSYLFNAPSNNKKALETGLLWFSDVVKNLALTIEDIDKERGVLIQELITRNGDNFSKSYNNGLIETRLIPCHEDDSNFFEHHKNFKPETLRDFYRDWYHPERVAVVVVGNIINIDELEAKIKSTFSSIKPSKNRTIERDCDSIYFNDPPRFAILEKMPDPISISNEVTMKLFFRDPKSSQKYADSDGILRKRKLAIFLQILNKRLKESSKNYNSFYDIQADHTNSNRQDPSAIRLKINAKENSEMEALETAISVLSQLIKGGIFESEFEKAKSDNFSDLQDARMTNSSFWMEGIKEYFIYGISFPKDKIKKEKDWLSNYNIEEFNIFLKTLNLDMPEDIGISALKGHPALSYTEKEIRSFISKIYKRSNKRYIPPKIPDFLMSSVETSQLEEKDFTELQSSESEVREFLLDNGVKLILKSFEPTPGVRKDKILLHGFKPKGALNFNSDDYFSAINGPEILKNNGVGELDKFEFQRFISNNSLWWYGIKPYVRNLESGIEIDAVPEDIEIMLQVVYLLLSEPRNSKNAFNDWKKNEVQKFEDQNIDLKYVDLNTNIEKIIDDDSGASYGTEQFNGLDKVDRHKAYTIYTQLLGNANDFTFIITGNFSIEKYLPLVNKYLGNLPQAENYSLAEEQNSSRINLPLGPVHIEFFFPDTYKKRNFMYRPHHVIVASDKFDWKENLRVKALGSVINNEVWGLRFNKEYSLYTVGAGGKYNPVSNQYKISASIDCVPEQLPLLRKEYAKIVSNLKTNFISEEILIQSLKRIKFLYGTQGRALSNKSINEKLYSHYRYYIPIVENKKVEEFIESLTLEDIRETARKYLKESNFFEFVMKGRE